MEFPVSISKSGPAPYLDSGFPTASAMDYLTRAASEKTPEKPAEKQPKRFGPTDLPERFPFPRSQDWQGPRQQPGRAS